MPPISYSEYILFILKLFLNNHSHHNKNEKINNLFEIEQIKYTISIKTRFIVTSHSKWE